jgi:hypothetical protein
MTRLFSGTAIALIFAGAAFAQAVTTPDASKGAGAKGQAEMTWLAQGNAKDVYASDVMGATLYVAPEGKSTIDARDEWESVGSVEDVLLTRDGTARAVLVDVGGFLGMGGKVVAAPIDAIRYVSDGESADDFFLVFAANRESLRNAPAYERPETPSEGAQTGEASPAGANAQSATRTQDSGAAGMTVAREGYARARADQVTAESLDGAAVYDAADEKIGSISELLLADGGKINEVVIDVGGFLGMGARPVAMKYDELTVLREDGGDDLRVYVEAARDDLEAMPVYKE